MIKQNRATCAIALTAGVAALAATTLAVDVRDRNTHDVNIDQLLQTILGERDTPFVVPYGADVQALADDRSGWPGALPAGAGDLGVRPAADNIVSLQCPNGGFNWPYGGCDSTFFNITAPITMGLLEAYAAIGDSTYLDAAVAGGHHDLGNTWGNDPEHVRFGSFDPAWFYMLSEASGDPVFEDVAASDFFGLLDEGMYGENNDVDTAAWIENHRQGRINQGWANLVTWDIQYIPWVAQILGTQDQAEQFRDAIIDGLNVINMQADQDGAPDGHNGHDVTAIAGGVHALARIGVTQFDSLDPEDAPALAGISTLEELADFLAGLQHANGFWPWFSGSPDADFAQTTAYAVLALEEAQAVLGTSHYSNEIASGKEYLWGLQDPADGAFWSTAGTANKNIQLQGDVLTALATATVVSVNTDECPGTQNIEITIDKSETPGIEIVGGQFFIEYDTSVLSGPSVSAGDAPFVQPFFVDIDEVAGTIDLGVGIEPGTSGTEAAATMAVITFDSAAEICSIENLVTFRQASQPTQLSDNFGDPVFPVLEDLPEVTIDVTPPTVVWADEGLSGTDGLGGSGELEGVLWRYADAGTCQAVVDWDPPVAGVDYFDNCTADGEIEVEIISAFQPGDVLQAGEFDTVTYVFRDACGNETIFEFDVHVRETSVLQVEVDIPGLAAGSVVRCLEAVIDSPFAGLLTEEFTVEFTDGVLSTWTTVPCDTECIQVRDPLHTLSSVADLDIVPDSGHPRAEYEFEGSATLISGDLNGDGVIDILDFGIFIWQFDTTDPDSVGNSPCGTAPPHADISGDGAVGTGDFTFIQQNFLLESELCPESLVAGPRPQPRERISVDELRRMGLGHLAIADLTGDGWVGPQDIAAFAAGVRPE